MMAARFSPAAVQKRLASLKRLLGELEKFSGITAVELEAEPINLYAVFFMLAQVVDLATDINQHLTKSVVGIGNEEGGRAFGDLVRAGVLPASLLPDFRRSAALRNIITHQYTDADLTIVAAAIPMCVELYSSYVMAVAEWLATSERA